MKKTLILTTFLLLTGSSVLAQGSTSNNPAQNNPLPSYTLLEPLPCIPSPAAKDINGNVIPGSEVVCTTAGATQNTVNFKFYIQYMFNLFIAIAAGAAVFMIVYGGLKYMSTDSWGGKADGIEKMKNALFGLVLILTSYIILRTIDPRLVNIPTTFVPALNIKYDKVTNDFFDDLINEASKYNIRAQNLVDDARKNKVEALTLEKELQDLQQELDAELLDFGPSPSTQDLEAKIDVLKQKINTLKASTEIGVAKSIMNNIISQQIQEINLMAINKTGNQGEINQSIAKSITAIDTIKNARVKSLEDLGNYEGKVQIEDEARNAKASLYLINADSYLINQSVIYPQTKTKIDNFLKLASEETTLVVNVEQKAELQKKFTQIEKTAREKAALAPEEPAFSSF